jgi:alpha-mannosidase
MTTVYVVSHTHWDREWYHPAARFRQRLVELVDELLASPPPSNAGGSFLLDGQTAVLEDYLTVRRDRAAELAMLLKSGVIEAGPWFALADELIPGGEAMVRNLFAGRRTLATLRALDHAPRVLYCPDSFGHPAALPALARGFGFGTVIAWRGFGSARWPAADACSWSAPGGERVVLYHLSRSGYELGANLPSDATAARERWRSIRAELLSRNRTGLALLLNGADHHARQRNHDESIAALVLAADGDEIKPGSLAGFVAALEQHAGNSAALPEIRGELRDSYGFTWTLQGTLATRAHQKRRNARLERLLVRDVEPWIALAARAGGGARRQLVEAAWRSLLLCHPHDTLCGCSTDEVANGRSRGAGKRAAPGCVECADRICRRRCARAPRGVEADGRGAKCVRAAAGRRRDPAPDELRRGRRGRSGVGGENRNGVADGEPHTLGRRVCGDANAVEVARA